MTKKVLFFLFLLNGCCPFLDTRREAGSLTPVGQSKPNQPAVCYNDWFNDMTDVQKIANDACPYGESTLKKQTHFSCTLFYPSTAFFECHSMEQKKTH